MTFTGPIRYAAFACLALGFVPGAGHGQSTMKPSKSLITASAPHFVSVAHIALDIDVPMDAFSRHFEALLGRFDPSVSKLIATDPVTADRRLAEMEGDQGLMLFTVQNHGALLGLAGIQRQSKRYHVGNPRIALQMTRHDVRAGLYAPLSVLVYETSPGSIRVEYDLPSTLFQQFGNHDVALVGKSLDAKLASVIAHAAELANRT